MQALPPIPRHRLDNCPLATAALKEIVEIYHMTEVDDRGDDSPLSGADVVAEIGLWMQTNHKLLRKLGIVGDDIDADG